MLFDHPDFDGHEQIIFCNNSKVGLRAIIALHSTALGPAAGGCRMQPYDSEADALKDVLRLSKGMTYKNAVAGLPLGGGKCVIIADPAKPNKPELLRAFAEYIQALAGRYWTAIDIGVGPEDADVLAKGSDFIFARASQYEPGFNPSEFTAFGGFMGIKAVADTIFNRTDLTGLRVAVQGLGATGYALCGHLYKAGAELIVADVRHDAVVRVLTEFGATSVDTDEIHSVDVDVFAPCALGAGLNDQTIPEIKAKAICGLANNQLAEDRHGESLLQAGIAYVPDYVVNAGGMMGASTVIFAEPSHDASIKQIEGLQDKISQILVRSQCESRPSSEIADAMARERIANEGRA